MGKREISLFTGAGGGLLGGHLLGWEPVAFVEYEAYPQKVLKARIADGSLPDVPVFGDVRDFDGTQWKGKVDVLSGGFPCQPFSVAGKRAAVDDPRNMWPETIRVLRECEAPEAFFENVPGLLTGGHGYFGTILKDINEAGYSAVWDCVGGAAVGAPHRRDRLWIYVWKAPNWTPKGLSPRAELEDDEWWPCDRVAELLRELGQQEPVSGSWSRAGILHQGVVYHLAPSSSSSGKTVDGGWPSSMLNIMTKPEIPAFWQPYPTPLAADPRRPVGLTAEERYTFATPTAFDCVNPKRQEVLDREHDDVRPGRTKPCNLRDQVQVEEGLRTWPTPTVQDSKNDGGPSQLDRHSPGLNTLVKMDGRATFPTPLAADGEKDPTNSLSRIIQTGHPRGRLDGTTREGDPIEERPDFPTPLARGSDRKSRGKLMVDSTGPALEQYIELDAGLLPKEYESPDELPPKARARYEAGLNRSRKEWPTPRANKTSGENPESFLRRKADGKVHTPPLALAVELAEERESFPTPIATEDRIPSHSLSRLMTTGELLCEGDRRRFPTPTTEDAGRAGSKEAWDEWEQDGRTTPFRLQNAIHSEDPDRISFPTPTAQPFGTMSSGYRDADNPGVKKESLDTMARNDSWPTPTAATNRKSTRAMTASKDNGRRSGGGQSSPPALEQAVELAEGIIPKELEGIPFEDLPEATRDMFPTPTATERSGINPNTGKGGGLSKMIAWSDEERGLWPTPRAQGMVGGSSIYKKAQALLQSGNITPEEATAMFDGIGRDAGGWPDQEVRQEYPTPRTANASMTAESDETLFARGRTGNDCLANVAQRLDEAGQDQAIAATIQREEWRTPSTMDAHGEFVREGKKLTGRKPSDPQVNLADQVAASERQEYPTPTASDGMRAGKAIDPDAWLESRARHAARGVNKHYSLDVAVHFVDQGRDPKAKQERAEWPTPSAARSGENEDFLDRLVTKDGEPAVRGERAYNPGAKHHAQLTLDRVVKLPSERDTFPTPAPGTHGRGAHAHKGVVNALLRDEKPEVQSLTVDIVMAGELRKVGVREVVTFRTGEVIMHDGSTRYITVDIQEDRKTWPTTTASDALGTRRSTARTDEWTSNPGTTLLDATLEADGEGTEGWQEDLRKKNPPPQLSPDWVEWLMGWPLGWTRLDGGTDPEGLEEWVVESSMNRWWWREPEGLARVTREKKDRVSRLKALGNGQVPASAAAAWLLLESTARAAEAGDAEISDLAGLFGMG